MGKHVKQHEGEKKGFFSQAGHLILVCIRELCTPFGCFATIRHEDLSIFISILYGTFINFDYDCAGSLGSNLPTLSEHESDCILFLVVVGRHSHSVHLEENIWFEYKDATNVL